MLQHSLFSLDHPDSAGYLISSVYKLYKFDKGILGILSQMSQFVIFSQKLYLNILVLQEKYFLPRVSLTYRVKSAHKLKLTDKQLLQWMAPILLIMLVYLCTWTLSAPPSAEDVSVFSYLVWGTSRKCPGSYSLSYIY